jgi:radical SAM protein with 4Fe4S-binding SPASM domain
LAACVAVGFPSSTMRPGLRSYRLNPPGGKRRVHLRVESDGSSLLLLDANDTLRLNPAATLVADLALRGFRRSQIAAARARRFGRSPAAHDAAEEIEQLIARLRRGEEVCLGCTLAEAGRAEPFSSSPSAPLKADLALTYRCNNACGHCYNPPQRTDMGSLDVRQWTAVLRRLRTIGVPHVVFTGGEPTLCDELPPLVRRAGRLGLVTGLNSNGRRLGQTDLAKRLARAGLDHVQITLESPRAETHNRMTGADSFAETVRGVGRCLDAGLHTITNTTLTRRNLDEAEELVDFLHGLGLRTFAANGMICAGAGRRHPDTIAEAELGPALVRLRDRAEERDMRFLWYTPTAYCRLSPLELELGPRRCNAAEYSICIEPNGQVLPCQSYYTPAGNILRDPWAEIWNSPLFRSFRERIADPAGCGLPRRCWECPERAICGGGCRLMEESACRGPCGRPEYQEAGHDGPTASLEGLGASPQTLPFISE